MYYVPMTSEFLAQASDGTDKWSLLVARLATNHQACTEGESPGSLPSTQVSSQGSRGASNPCTPHQERRLAGFCAPCVDDFAFA